VKRLSPFSGEQIVQVTNPDPFAKPVLRTPVLHTPVWIIACVQLVRLIWRLLRFLARHPLADLIVAALALAWRYLGWPGPVTIAGTLVAATLTWRLTWPASWTRHVAGPTRARWRRWHYNRCWTSVMTISGLAVYYRGRLLLPLLGPVTSTCYLDRLHVRLISGRSPDDFAARSDNLAHGFGALSCRIRTAGPGAVVVELVRRDALAAVIPALPIPDRTDLRAVHVGRREDGTPWTIRLHGSHVLLAGSTGAGKASILWAIIRALLPALHDGTARVLAADPKLMELAYGRPIFDRYGRYECDPERIIAMLEDAVTSMQTRAGVLAGRQRDHQPTTEHPFVVVLVDEVAFLTAYQPDRKLRDRALGAIATLTTQGRAVGYAVVAALQDPRKDVLAIRNLFPDRIAMRLDEPEQVDMVLGDGSRDRGALADLIPADPATGAGIAYVRVDPDPDPVRVRAAWVTDDDITAISRHYAPRPGTVPDLSADREGALA
jgi:DNA segregation ATPase FtsK/SpoIIIE, S-DNA-T family